MLSDPSERIAVLETKVDLLLDALGELKVDVRNLGQKQDSIGLNVNVAYSIGKWFLGGLTGFLSYVHWDQVVALLHQITSDPKH